MPSQILIKYFVQSWFKIANAEVYHQFLEEVLGNTSSNGIIDYTIEERSGIGSFITNWGIVFGLLFTIPVLVMWLVFKLFWSAKPKETAEKDSNHLHSISKTESNEPLQQAANFPVRIGDRTIFLEMNKIVSFQAKDNYVNLLDTEDNTYLIEYTLNELEEKLPSQFVRIHRSYIVNKLLIKEIRKYSGNRFTVHLNGKKSQQFVSSQSYAPKVKELMKF